MPTPSHGRERGSYAAVLEQDQDGRPALPTDPGEAWRTYRHTRARATQLRRRARRASEAAHQKQLAVLHARILTMRNELVERELPVLVQVTERLKLSLPRFVERDDLYLSGVPALINTVERFRPARGNRFDTFAIPRLRGAILDALRKMDPVPRLARKRNQVRSEAVQAFLKAHGRPPDDEETRALIKNVGGVEDDSEQARVMKEKPIPASVSIDAPVAAGRRSDPLTLGEQLQGEAPSPLTDAQRADLKRYITERLPRRERLMILLYYFENMTMQEVGKTLGISESRVSQSMKQLLAEMRVRLALREEELKE